MKSERNNRSPGTPATRPIRRVAGPGGGNTQSGAALVITLAILVLVVVLVLSIFLSTTTERSESAASSNQGDSQRLAALAVDLVKSAVTQATTGYESNADGTPDLSRLTAWASQPGLIRTWRQNGDPEKSYCLYSSGNITTSGALNVAAERAALDDWKSGAPASSGSYNALWCDLNAPGVAAGGSLVYPIVTPPSDLQSGSAVSDPVYGVPTDNPATAVQEGVQGFSVSAAPGFTAGNASATNNPAPMPVKWLYVRQDGSVFAPGGNGSVATGLNAAADNPIVGRVAYWTDDETCKVNINTASEGVFWDIPYGINNEEKGRVSPLTLGYSLSVPVSDEYQRLPGHPAFTSLSAVLGEWLPRPNIGFGSAGASTYPSGTSYGQNLLPYYNLSPRIAGGGTEGGTRSILSGGSLALDAARLYSNANEFLYAPQLAGTDRELNNPALPAATVRQLPFFLTASNRAPETTLFERPRISLWPCQIQSDKRNAKDLLLDLASILNRKAYHFHRAATFTDDANPGSSQSQTLDLPPGGNNEGLLLAIKQDLLKTAPGFGAAFGAGKDLNRLLVQTFDSIRSLVNTVSRALPPYYTYAPFGPPGDSIINPTGIGAVVPIAATPSLGGSQIKGFGRFPTLREVGILFYATDWRDETTLNPTPPHLPNPGPDGLPDDMPDSNGNYNGIGDPQTTAMRAIVYLVPLNISPGQPDTAPAVRYKIEGLENLRVDWAGVVHNLGFPAGSNAVLLTRPGGMDISPYPDSGFLGMFQRPTRLDGAWPDGGRSLQISDGTSVSPNRLDPENTIYPFFSGTVPISPMADPLRFGLESDGNYRDLRPGSGPQTFSFSGGTITVKIFAGTGNAMPGDSEYIQKFEIELPEMVLPVPFVIKPIPGVDSAAAFQAAAGTVPWYSGFLTDGRNFENRLTEVFDGSVVGADRGNFFRRGDVVRSLQWNVSGPSRADARVIASLRDVTAADFSPMDGYLDPDRAQIHGVVARSAGGINSYISPGFGNSRFSTNPATWQKNKPASETRGKLAAALAYSDYSRPYVPAAMSAALMTGRSGGDVAGDWNTGSGNTYDGAFINKGDEGYVNSTGSIYSNIYFPANRGNASNESVLASFSPIRQIPSPVLFGSLPLAPWRTLLFCPNPAARSDHPGFGGGGPDIPPPYISAPDHLFLDQFWMPVVEPYAISEPCSTNGKTNLNFQLAPFTHIERATGIYAALKAMKIPALPTARSGDYKMQFSSDESAANPSWRHDIDVEATVAGMKDRRFGTGGQGFRSASEICTVFLVPKTNASGVGGPAGGTPLQRYNNTSAWWDDKLLTGDNLRESPYGQIYPRVTTKSNTYTVHYRVQALKQVPAGRRTAADWDKWDESKDKVVSEFRGSSTIERYVDPKDPDIPDFTLPANYNKNLAPYYQWRTLEQKRFVP